MNQISYADITALYRMLYTQAEELSALHQDNLRLTHEIQRLQAEANGVKTRELPVDGQGVTP